RLEPGVTPTYAGYTAWRGVAAVGPSVHDGLAASEAWGRGERFGLVPMTGSRVYWYATANTAEGEREAAGEWQAVFDRFSGWLAPIAEVLESTDPDAVLRNDVYDRRPLRRRARGNVVVIGDRSEEHTS